MSRLINSEDVKALINGLDSLPWEEEVDELVDRIPTAFDNGFKQGEKYGYKKAIDDFADKISTYGTYDDYGNVIDILEIAEELKKEGAECKVSLIKKLQSGVGNILAMK